MDFKKEIEKLLEQLKSEGIDRRTIEKDLKYSENYIDQALSKGGNKKLHKSLLEYVETKGYSPSADELITERIIIKQLVLEVAKLKSKLYGGKVNDYLQEFEDNTSATLRDIVKG